MRWFNTEKHKKYWANRKIDWNQSYLSTWNHPHRDMIVYVLKQFGWFSLWEVGCGPGANLIKIAKEIPNKQLGGCDVSADAIELAKSTFRGGMFHVESVEDMLLSDKAVDVILSDAALIYIDPRDIKKTLKEMVRCTRNRLVLCEFHSPSLWKRWLFRFKTGYNVYDYKKLLKDAGCYDILMMKIPPAMWPGCKKGDGWYDYGYLITAKVV